jgi:DNA-binding XRE family transcriptional regulator
MPSPKPKPKPKASPPSPPTPSAPSPSEEARKKAASAFSARLRQARQRAGFQSPAAVAKQLGLTREGYGRLERGNIMPRADILLRLAPLFNVSVDWLLGLKENP